MKTFTSAALTSVGVTIFLSVSCTKNEVNEPASKKKSEAICDVSLFTQQYSGGNAGYIFSKAYDLSGQRLSSIDCGLYSGGSIWDTVHLNLSYDAAKIYFISSENASDTGLVLHLDNAGRPLRADVGQIIDDGFGPQVFSYENGRLSGINIDNDWMRFYFRYDAHGNNTEILSDSSDGYPRVHHTYQYDGGKKNHQQLYMDEARGFSLNVLTILHAAGFLTELNPQHTRTRSTVKWGPYTAYDNKLQGHVFDKSGRLLQYKAGSTTHTLSYNCATSNNNLITMAQ